MKPSLRYLVLPLIALIFFSVLPAIFLRPLWAVLLAFALLAARVWLHRRDLPMPARYFLWTLQLAVGLLVWQHFQSIFGDEAAGTLLLLLTCLKTYELNGKRDFFVAAILCALLLMTFLLADQSLALTLFMMVNLSFIVAYLKSLEDEKWRWDNLRANLTATFSLMLKSIPLMVLVFLLFPRFSTGFGAGDDIAGKTGVSDQLRPGAISQLITSDELVFRATFLRGEIPPRHQLYWRAAVLDRGIELNWDRSLENASLSASGYATSVQDIEVYLEPGFDKFLFSLENTVGLIFPNDSAGTKVLVRSGSTFELRRSLQTRERYFLQQTEAREAKENEVSLRRYLQLGSRPTAAMQKLLSPMRGLPVGETVRRLMEHFSAGEYQYSLQPPKSASIDDFLFKNKIGFCEHYAATLATMLRHLNIPSRVVVGFQGGVPSLLGNYITVRGYDAHAWVEYYDSLNKRWRRLDPTAQLAPARITQGSDMYLETRGYGFFNSDFGIFLRQGQRIFDEAEAAWIGFLLRFDLARQKEILASLGMEVVLFRALPVFLMLSLALILSVLYYLESHRLEPLPEQERLYRSLLQVLKNFSFEKGHYEGPLAVMRRLEAHNSELAEEVRPLLEALVVARFAPGSNSSIDLRDVRLRLRRLRRFRPVAAKR